MIALAMREPGQMTRVLGPSHGSFLTYASMNDAGATAPGQITAREMREMLEMVTQKGGTAEGIVLPGYKIAGKTGTAQKVDPATRR